jgi:hypothetical protein
MAPKVSRSKRTRHQPAFYLLDRRADQIANIGIGADPNQLLNTRETADWLSVSYQWLEIGRCKKYGPPFRRVGPKTIRYHVGDVLAWLETRKHVVESKKMQGAA